MVKPDAMAPDAAPRLVRWVSRARRAAIVVVGAVLITAIVKFVALAELVKKVTDYLEFTQSPALRLAENTAKSDFSDRLTRMAWRRLYLARLFAQRVVDEAPLGEIDSAWSTYINASADWNAELIDSHRRSGALLRRSQERLLRGHDTNCLCRARRRSTGAAPLGRDAQVEIGTGSR